MRVITLISSARATKTVRLRLQLEHSASSAATKSVGKRECSAEVSNVSQFFVDRTYLVEVAYLPNCLILTSASNTYVFRYSLTELFLLLGTP